MQSHHVRLPEVRGRVGGVTGLATRALVVTALVGGTGAYLHASTASSADQSSAGAERFSAAALHEVSPEQSTELVSTQGFDLAPPQATEPASGTAASSTTRQGKLVHVFHDGCTTNLVTTAQTVVGALTQASVKVGIHDLVRPGMATEPRTGMGIHVIRVKIRIEHKSVTLPFGTIRKADPRLAKGRIKVVRHGHSGMQRVTYRVVLHDGKVDSRKIVKRVTVVAPLARVVHYGTKRSASRAKRGVDSLNWHALAVCESGDNPHAVGGGGSYFGLYQFTVGTWHSVGGKGNPRDASRAEQTKRAKILYERRGTSPWPVCGSKLYT